MVTSNLLKKESCQPGSLMVIKGKNNLEGGEKTWSSPSKTLREQTNESSLLPPRSNLDCRKTKAKKITPTTELKQTLTTR